MIRKCQQRNVLMVDKVSRKPVLEFKSSAECGRHLGIPEGTVHKQCQIRALSSFTDVYFRFADDFDKNEVFRAGRGCPIYAKRGNKVRMFFCLNDAASAFGKSKSTMTEALKRGELCGVEIGYLTEGLGVLNGD